MKIVKLVVFVVTILLMIGMTIYLFPVMKNLSTYEGQIAFKEKVNNLETPNINKYNGDDNVYML